MNLSIQPTEDDVLLHASCLISLFEAKGYTCEQVNNLDHTMYLFKADSHPHIDYTKDPNPNWQIIRSSNPGIDWL